MWYECVTRSVSRSHRSVGWVLLYGDIMWSTISGSIALMNELKLAWGNHWWSVDVYYHSFSLCRSLIASGRQWTTARCYSTAAVLLILSGLLFVLFMNSRNPAPVIKSQQQTLVYNQEESIYTTLSSASSQGRTPSPPGTSVAATETTPLESGANKLHSPVFTSNVSMSLFASDRFSVVVQPERVVTSADVSNVFVSILTVPKYHRYRFAYQLMTWVQTFNPAQVCVWYVGGREM